MPAVIEPLQVTPLQRILGLLLAAAITAFAAWRIARWARGAIRRLRRR
jgi:hypothetical protein